VSSMNKLLPQTPFMNSEIVMSNALATAWRVRMQISFFPISRSDM
jgi:hypothetical protein